MHFLRRGVSFSLLLSVTIVSASGPDFKGAYQNYAASLSAPPDMMGHTYAPETSQHNKVLGYNGALCSFTTAPILTKSADHPNEPKGLDVAVTYDTLEIEWEPCKGVDPLAFQLSIEQAKLKASGWLWSKFYNVPVVKATKDSGMQFNKHVWQQWPVTRYKFFDLEPNTPYRFYVSSFMNGGWHPGPMSDTIWTGDPNFPKDTIIFKDKAQDENAKQASSVQAELLANSTETTDSAAPMSNSSKQEIAEHLKGLASQMQQSFK